MNQNRNMPVPGEFYRHFKNKLYQIITVAFHSETGEPMVVYQALYGEFKTWARPLSMFMGEVDREKYPDVKQKYRFEKVVFAKAAAAPEENGGALGAAGGDSAGGQAGGGNIQEEPQMNPYLLEFLDALDSKNYDKKLEYLARLHGHVTQKEMDDIYMILDMPAGTGTMEEQLAAVRRQLMLLRKFDGERLR